jgi:hypothetical protein
MTKQPQRPRDPNQLAKFVIDAAAADAPEAPTKGHPSKSAPRAKSKSASGRAPAKKV